MKVQRSVLVHSSTQRLAAMLFHTSCYGTTERFALNPAVAWWTDLIGFRDCAPRLSTDTCIPVTTWCLTWRWVRRRSSWFQAFGGKGEQARDLEQDRLLSSPDPLAIALVPRSFAYTNWEPGRGYEGCFQLRQRVTSLTCTKTTARILRPRKFPFKDRELRKFYE